MILCVDDALGSTATSSKKPYLDDDAVKQLFHVRSVAKPAAAATPSPSPQLAAVPAKPSQAGPIQAQPRPISGCGSAPGSIRQLKDYETSLDTSAAAYLARPGLLRRIKAEQRQLHGPAAFQRGPPPANLIVPAQELTSKQSA
jgi:hypothetical protein